jgi:hypothetical protein
MIAELSSLDSIDRHHFLDVDEAIYGFKQSGLTPEVIKKLDKIYSETLQFERKEQEKKKTMVHGDLKYSNMIKTDSSMYVFDFERLGWGSPFVDFGRFYNPNIHDVTGIAREYYFKIGSLKLSSSEKKTLMPYTVPQIKKATLLFSLLHHGSHLPFLLENNLDPEIHIHNMEKVYHEIINRNSMEFLKQ